MIKDQFLYFAQYPSKEGICAILTNGSSEFPSYNDLAASLDNLPNVLANFKVNGSVVGTTQWIGTYLCVFMMVRECFSCVENIQAIYPIFPTSFVRRLKDFNDKGEYIKKD